MTPSHLHQLLLSNDTARIVAFSENHTHTLGELQLAVAATVSILRSYQQQRFLLVFDDPWYHLIAMLGVHQVGGCAVFPANHSQAVVSDLAKDALVLSDYLRSEDTLVIDASLAVEQRATLQPVAAVNCSIELQTSGSTGQPKRIQKSLYGLEQEALVLEQTFHTISTSRNVYATVSHNHIYGLLFRLIWPLMSERAFDRRLYRHADIPTANAVWVTSPVYWQQMNNQAATSVCAQIEQVDVKSQVPVVFCSGGPLSYALARTAQTQAGALPYEVYGSTETGGIAWRQQQDTTIPWTLFSGLSYQIDHGRMLLSSPFIEQTPAYLTDDRVEVVTKNQFRLLGRIDRIVKVAEKRISLTQLEKLTESMPGISRCVALMRKTPKRDVVNFVVVADDGFINRYPTTFALWRAVRKQLSSHVESVALPRKIEVVDSLPQNTQGKIDTAKLMELLD
ncbi:AMP-binding protein [Thaumasiovibrio sp. DFM-14]|uniref:AMP-binding protein n=1 Tax=Thaumasiovibrio sp. DFM-14 TaxID=3384792 RepID=UPI0039A2F0D4